MKNNKRHIIIKRIKEIDAKKNYSGEASPYWDDAQKRSQAGGIDDLREDPFANPDVLPENSTPYYRPLTEQGKLMLQAVEDVMTTLTPRQRSIVQLMHEGVWSEAQGERLYTEQAVADTLRVARLTVRTVLARVKTKVRQRYEILEAAKE